MEVRGEKIFVFEVVDFKRHQRGELICLVTKVTGEEGEGHVVASCGGGQKGTARVGAGGKFGPYNMLAALIILLFYCFTIFTLFFFISPFSRLIYYLF